MTKEEILIELTINVMALFVIFICAYLIIKELKELTT